MPKKDYPLAYMSALRRHEGVLPRRIEPQMPRRPRSPLTGCPFAYRRSIPSGLAFIFATNYLRVQGGSDGALAAVSQPLTVLTHTFHRAPHCLPPSNYPNADRNAPSQLGRVGSAKNITYSVSLLNVEERAAVCLRSNCSSISRSCAHLRICRARA